MSSKNCIEGKVSLRKQYLAAFVMNIMTFTNGCAVGWVSPNLPNLTNKDGVLSEPLTMAQVSLVGSMWCLGGMLATPFFGWTSDRFGRKTTGHTSALPFLISWLLKLTCRSANGIIAARFLAGVGGGAILVSGATYCVEIATTSTRGFMGSMLVFSFNLGIVVMYTMGAYLSYNTVLVIMVTLPIVFFALMFRMPETPAYLMKNKRNNEALKAIAWLRRVQESNPIAQKEFGELKFSIDLAQTSTVKGIRNGLSNENQDSPLKYLFTVKTTFKAFLACFIMMSVKAFLGTFAIITYANDIFRMSGSSFSNNVSSIIVGLIQLIGSVVGSLLIEKLGRKILLISSCATVSLSMFTMGSYFYAKSLDYDLSTIYWVPLIALSIAVSTFAMGIGSIPYALPSELIPVQARALANGIIMNWTWVAGFLITLFFAYFVEMFGTHTVFWGFSCSGIVGIFVTTLFLPETKGKSLEYIISYYGGNKKTENVEQLL